jgi:hypothetical protein
MGIRLLQQKFRICYFEIIAPESERVINLRLYKKKDNNNKLFLYKICQVHN